MVVVVVVGRGDRFDSLPPLSPPPGAPVSLTSRPYDAGDLVDPRWDFSGVQNPLLGEHFPSQNPNPQQNVVGSTRYLKSIFIKKKKKKWNFYPFVYYSLLVVVVPKKGKEQPALAITSDRWGSERHHPSNERPRRRGDETVELERETAATTTTTRGMMQGGMKSSVKSARSSSMKVPGSCVGGRALARVGRSQGTRGSGCDEGRRRESSRASCPPTGRTWDSASPTSRPPASDQFDHGWSFLRTPFGQK